MMWPLDMTRRSFVAAVVATLILAAVPPALADLSDTVLRLKPSVVLVGTFRVTDSPRFQLRGAGFIVGNGRTVVTSAHVVPSAGGVSPDNPALVVQVRELDEWRTRSAKVLVMDSVRDLVLLHIDGPAGPALEIGDSNSVREGAELAFMGFPIGGVLGFSVVTHRASVSSITSAALPSPSAQSLKAPAIRGLRNGTYDIFQLDATAYPGNSGGPLFDTQTGKVVGVMNLVLIKSTRESALSQPSGISYAIPSAYVRELLDGRR